MRTEIEIHGKQMFVNGKIVDNPFLKFSAILIALALVGLIVACILFVLLPLAGILVASLFALATIILVPLLLWFIAPLIILMIAGRIIAWLQK